MVLGLGKAANFVRRRNRGEPQSGGAGLPSTTKEAELVRAQVRAAGQRGSQADRTAAEVQQWEADTLRRNLKAIQTPDPNWQPPDVWPELDKLTQRQKHARDYVYQMTKNNIWYAAWFSMQWQCGICTPGMCVLEQVQTDEATALCFRELATVTAACSRQLMRSSRHGF